MWVGAVGSLDSTDCKDSKGYKGFIEIPTAERRISWKGAGAPRKEEFKDAGFALEQDGCAPEIFESQHRSMGSRRHKPRLCALVWIISESVC